MTIPALLFLLATVQASEGQAPTATAESQRSGLWIGEIAFSPADIASATQEWDDLGTPIVIVTFTESGQAKFNQAQQGRVGQVLEIRVDGELVASPFLMEIVAGNRISITGSFTREEATALARRIARQDRGGKSRGADSTFDRLTRNRLLQARYQFLRGLR